LFPCTATPPPPTFPESVETINIGGGFFGHMHPDMPFKDAPSFDEYAEVVCGILNGSDWAQKQKPTLIIEPGVAMVADAVSFITKVVSVKPIKERIFVTVDGSAFNTKPTFHAVNMPHHIIRQNEEGPTLTFDVVGSTCMEKDILLKGITAPLPQPGDYIRIDSIGAYTLVMTPPFINPAPAILADEADQVKCVRKKQTMEDIFSNYRFEQ
jgi:diaminopimelate decarboxylase